MFQMEIDVHDEDLEVIKDPMATSKDVQDPLAFMISQKRKHVEVSLRNCNAEERRPFEEANFKETDQWVSNSVFKSFEELEYQSKNHGHEMDPDMERGTRRH